MGMQTVNCCWIATATGRGRASTCREAGSCGPDTCGTGCWEALGPGAGRRRANVETSGAGKVASYGYLGLLLHGVCS